MTQQKLSIDDIKKIADEVRLIKDFSENHNFNAGLINASLSPAAPSKNDHDWPLIIAFLSALFLLFAIGAYNFSDDLSQKAAPVVFVLCLIFGGISTMAVHKRFENLTLTLIAGGVLLAAMLIGCRVFTVQEAISEAKSYIHNNAEK